MLGIPAKDGLERVEVGGDQLAQALGRRVGKPDGA